MKNFILLLTISFLFSGLTFVKAGQATSVTHYKSGSYKVTTGNRSDTYDKYGKKKSSTVTDSLGNTTTITYDKNGNKTKTTVKEANGTIKIYDKNGKLTKKKQVTNY